MAGADRERKPAEISKQIGRPARSVETGRGRETRVLALQHAAGNRAVAGALGAQRVQRQALDPDEILKVVESSKFLKQKLASSTSAQKLADRRGRKAAQDHGGQVPPIERMRDRVRETLRSYTALFGGGDTTADNAMMLAMAVEGAAKAIADELYDPGLKPKVSEILFKVYGPKIKDALAKKKSVGGDGAGRALEMAKVLTSGDPVALYMHDEMRLEHAAHEIDRMGQAAAVTPRAMFDTLSRRYQSELASMSLSTVKAQEHGGSEGAQGSYKVSEASGELSEAHFKQLFGDELENDRPKARAQNEGGGLKFTQDAAAKLDQLRDAVETGKGKPLPATADERLKQHFKDVKRADKAIGAGREARVKADLKARFKIDDGKADSVIAKLKAGLPGLPLTLTVWGSGWFGKPGGPESPVYGAVTGGSSPKRELAKLIGVKGTKTKKQYGTNTLEHRGKYEHEKYGEERGADYLRFRHWKDQTMTGNLGFEPSELPKFGAANVHWKTTRGTEGRREAKDQDLKPQDIGVNYYGDTHFLLDKTKVSDRTIYTASDHGQPHRDPFLAFADFLLAPDAAESYGGKKYRSDVTRLKTPTGPGTGGVRNTPFAMDIINAVLDPDNAPLVKRGLPLEIQIFGEVRIDRDVSEIHVSPSAPAGVFANADAWAKANAPHVGVSKIDVPDASRVPVAAKFAALEAAAKQAVSSKG